MPRLRIASIALACALVACKSTPRKADGDAGAAVLSASSAPGLTRPIGNLQPDAALLAELQRVAGTCTYVEASASAVCPAAQLAPLREKIAGAGPAGLETLLAAVMGGAPALASLAATEARTIYNHDLGRALERAAVPERVRSALIELLEKAPSSTAFRLAPVATFVASRDGRLDEVLGVAERRPELRPIVASRVMRYGRMQAFAKVQAWVGSDDETLASSALEALRFMDDWKDEERAELGPWLGGLLEHPSKKVQSKAAALLLHGDEAMATRGFGWLDAAIAGNHVTRDTVFAFGRRCRPDNHAELTAEELEKLANSPLCLRMEKTLGGIVADEGVESGVRNAALETLASTWPKLALPRARALTKSADARLAETARNVVKDLGK